jgi:RNA polymerase sigma-70 factor (ECF subfamily)
MLQADDSVVLERLRAGDEATFEMLVDTHGAALMRVAVSYVSTPSVAEEVVQEAWIAFLESLDRFEGRSSLKTWLFRILMNQAMKRGAREARTVPFSAAVSDELQGHDAAVKPDRFRGSDDRWPGHWHAVPRSWAEHPEDRLLARETGARIADAIRALPRA